MANRNLADLCLHDATFPLHGSSWEGSLARATHLERRRQVSRGSFGVYARTEHLGGTENCHDPRALTSRADIDQLGPQRLRDIIMVQYLVGSEFVVLFPVSSCREAAQAG